MDRQACIPLLPKEKKYKFLLDCSVKGNILKRHVCLATWYALLIPPLIWTVYKGDSRINKWIKELCLAKHQKHEVNIETSNTAERDMDPSRAELSTRINHTHIHQPGKPVKTSRGCVRADGKKYGKYVYLEVCFTRMGLEFEDDISTSVCMSWFWVTCTLWFHRGQSVLLILKFVLTFEKSSLAHQQAGNTHHNHTIK